MQVGVIGTINRDTVLFPDGSRRLGWGGILYNLRTLSNLLGPRDIVTPACKVGRDCYAPVMLELKRMKNVRTDLVKPVDAINNHCRLTYHDGSEKTEILEGGVPALGYRDIEPLRNCRYILVNFISGRDVTIGALEKLKQNTLASIYTDIHSYTMARRRDGSRYLRRPKNWLRLIKLSNLIQMNRAEMAVLIRNDYRKLMREPVEQNIMRLIDILCRKEIDPDGKRFIVTDGIRGCHLIFASSGGPEICTYPPKHIMSGDTTGCGDSFAAGYIAALARISTRDQCAILALKAASDCIIQNEKWRNKK